MTDRTPPPTAQAEAFAALRPKLFGIAYRMLQARADAEDAVQDAWVRLSGTERIDSLEGFLTTTVTRICIDHLRSARVRRETYVGPWLPEPMPTGPGHDDPDAIVERAEALSIAMLLVIDQLDPVERAVFLLREAFGYAYADIAPIVGKREDHCRQIARRAVARMRADRPSEEADAETHERLLGGFLGAAVEGDLARLEALLADDVVLFSDGGGKVAAATRPIAGALNVARFMVGIASKRPADTTVEPASLNGYPSLVVRIDGRPALTISLDVADDRIRRVFITRNPDKLTRLA